LQLTLGHVVECIRDHVRLLDDLPNGTTLTLRDNCEFSFSSNQNPRH
jgi:hypothetical protein